MAGSLNGVPFAGSTTFAAGGGFGAGVSRAALQTSGVSAGQAEVQLERADAGPAQLRHVTFSSVQARQVDSEHAAQLVFKISSHS